MARRTLSKKARAFANLKIKDRFLAMLRAADTVMVDRVAKPVFEIAKDRILDIVERRYTTSFGVKKGGPDVVAAFRSEDASYVVSKGKTVQIYIAQPDAMNLKTKLPATKATGKGYTLWSLLREGWGRRGGTRPDNYVLAIKVPGGISAPYPDLLRQVYAGRTLSRSATHATHEVDGIPHTLIKHPGFVGIDWLTQQGKAYSEDLAIVFAAQKNVTKKVAKAFSEGTFLKVAK